MRKEIRNEITFLEDLRKKLKPYWDQNPALTMGEAMKLYIDDLQNDAFEEGYELGETDGIFGILESHPLWTPEGSA